MNKCFKCKKTLLYRDRTMAYLLPKDRNKRNVLDWWVYERLSQWAKDRMYAGTMSVEVFHYENHCEERYVTFTI